MITGLPRRHSSLGEVDIDSAFPSEARHRRYMAIRYGLDDGLAAPDIQRAPSVT